jgi:exonuclease SbcC
MRFNKLKIEGFGSIGNSLEFDLAKKGINLIKGKNGSGKTTIFNAFAWCLYGANLKGITNGLIATKKTRRPPSYQGTCVSVSIEFDSISYIVTRHLKFKGLTFGLKGDNSLMVHKLVDGQYKMETSELFKCDQQGFINRLIGMDYKVFVNSVLFGQRMSRLVSASGSEKRAIFEELFSTGYASLAKSEAKLQLDNTVLQIKDIEKDTEVLKSKQSYIQSQYDKSKQVSEGFEGNKQKSIQDHKNRLEELGETKVTLNSALKQFVSDIESCNINLSSNKELLSNFDSSELIKTRELLKEGKEELSYLKGTLRGYETKLGNVSNDIRSSDNSISQLKRNEESERSTIELKLSREKEALLVVKTSCHACGKPINKEDIEGIKLSITKEIERLDRCLIDLSDNISSKIESIYLVKKDVLLPNKEYLNSAIDLVSLDVSKQNIIITNLQEKELDQSKGIAELEGKIYKLESKIESLGNSKDSTNSRLQDNHNSIAQSELDLVNSRKLTAPTTDFESMLSEIKLIGEQVGELNLEHTYLTDNSERLKYWATKGFASTGMSSYIFGVRLGELNKYIHKYSQRVGVSIEMGIDLDKASKPIYTKVTQSDNTVLDHKELSGGEQQLVDVCIAFGTHEMVSKTLPLLILDEVFENLDPANIDKVFDFVRLKVDEGKDVFIITHQQDLDFTYTKVIEVSKVDNLTQLR